jgi:hypothetical protein
MPGVTRDSLGVPIPQVVPNKTRCGSLDPVDMTEENKCSCKPKDDYGSGNEYIFSREHGVRVLRRL